MKIVFLSVLIAVGTLCPVGSSVAADTIPPVGTADLKPAKPSGPQIEFDSLVYDFGKTNAGTLVKHEFMFTNTGTATLQITDVRPGCGCTTAGAWDKSVEPGKTGIIPLQYNSTGYVGPVAKTATVTCNDPAHSNLVLRIQGTIWKPIEVTQQMAVFNVLSDSQTNEIKTVRITSMMDEPITLSDLQVSSNNAFRAELKTVHPGKEFELQITAAAPFTATNPVAVPITMKTSSPKMPTVNVTAYLTVRSPVTISPAEVALPPGKLSGSMGISLMVRNEGATPLSLSDLKVDYPGAEIRLTETVPGRVFSLALTLPEGFQLKEDQKAAITMKSNHPKFPMITIPVIQKHPSYFPNPAQSAAAKLVPGSSK